MNIEIDENTSLTTIICIAIICISSAAMFGCHESEKTYREAIKNGLQQKQNPGCRETLWIKPAFEKVNAQAE